MTKEEARKVLCLPEWYTPEDLEKAYIGQRDTYYPPMHELFSKHDEAHVKEQMLEQMKSYNYAYPMENMDKGPSGRDKAQYAFIRFGDVCDAYHILKNDKDYVPYRLDGKDVEGYWTVLYGRAGAAVRKKAAAFSHYTLWLLIPLVIAWIAAGVMESLLVGMIATVAFVALHWGIPCWLTPWDFLFYIPKGWWKGVQEGADHGLCITKLYSIIFCSLGFLFWWTIKFIFRPCKITEDWEFEFSERRDYVRRCKKLIPLRYARTKEQVEAFGKEHMGNKVEKARSAYMTIRKWAPQARSQALAEMEEQVKKQNPQYQRTVAQARSDTHDLRFFENYLKEKDERYSKFADWVADDSYQDEHLYFHGYDQSVYDSMMEKHDERVKGSYDYVDQQKMHFALQAEIARQRQLLECCVMLSDIM